ncbi:MAG: DUF4132 domain-containing protein [Micrococcales bacterium]|nr:DUF4132 domain-containing protein [Micrococcales bacterium]
MVSFDDLDGIIRATELETVQLPSYEPLPDTVLGEPTVVEIERMLARTDNRSFTRLDIDQLIAQANGAPAASQLAGRCSSHVLASQVPSLGLRHLLRLRGLEDHPEWICQHVDPETDLRAVADVLAEHFATSSDRPGGGRAPGSIQQFQEVQQVIRALAREVVAPQAAWPWLYEHPEVTRGWLTGSAGDQTAALQILACFPRVPSYLVSLVASVALGESKTNRWLARRALASYPTVRALAEQGLTDGKAVTRTAAAGWLAAIGDDAALPALRTALGQERREVVRAALLGALKTLGADLTAELSPERLATEAAKGLKGKPPASMAWFDLDRLPALRWADGSAVAPQVIRWWVVLAVKAKNPDGSGLLDLYLSLLHPDDADRLGRTVLHAWIDQDLRRPDPAESQAYVQSHPWLSYAAHQAHFAGSAIADKGMLALTTRMSGADLAPTVQGYLRDRAERAAHVGSSQAGTSQAQALLHALYGNGQPAALQLLLSIARRYKQATVQAKAMELVEQLAEARGWTADELADRTIPTAGFDTDRALHLDLGPRQVLGHLTSTGTITLSVAGKTVKSMPAQRVDDDPERYAAAKKQLATARKEVKAVLALQTSRLYEAMCTGRTWAVADWQQHFADHPLVRDLAARLIWTQHPDAAVARGAFRLTDDGTCVDTDDEQVTLDPGSRVGLAHATTLGPQATAAWREHLADYEITPPFSQLDTPALDLPAQTTVIDDLKGHLTDSFAIRSVATKRGYARGPVEDGGWFYEYTKTFTSQGLVAVLEFTGTRLPVENTPAATKSLTFRQGRRRLPLSEVPPVLAAECYADYTALAALGPYDPDWESKSQY